MKSSQRIFLVFLLFISMSSMAENWTRLFTSNDGKSTVLIDFDSVSKDGNLVSTWIKYPNDGTIINLSFTQVNCKEASVAYHKSRIHNDGTIKTYTDKFWYKFPMNENTIALEIYNRFC